MANGLTEQDHTTSRYNFRDRAGRGASTIATINTPSATPIKKDKASKKEKAAQGAKKKKRRIKANSGDGNQEDMVLDEDEDIMELRSDEENTEMSNDLGQNLDTSKDNNHNPHPSALEKQKDLSQSLSTTLASRGKESLTAKENYSNPLKRKHSSSTVDIGTLLMSKPDVKDHINDMENHLASMRLDKYHLCQLQLFALISEDVPLWQLQEGLPGLSKVVLGEMINKQLLSDIRDGSKEVDMGYQVSDKDARQKKNWQQWDLLCDAVSKAMKAHGAPAMVLTEAEVRALSDGTVPPPVSTQAPTKIKAYLAFVANRPDLLKLEEDWFKKAFPSVYRDGDRTIKDAHRKRRQVMGHDDQTGRTQMKDEFANIKTQVENLQKLVKEKDKQIEELKISEDERQVNLQLQSEKESTDRATVERAEENLRESKAKNAILETEIISMGEENKRLNAKINNQDKEKDKLETLLTTHRLDDLKRVGELGDKAEDIQKLRRHLEQKEEKMEGLEKERISREKETETLVAQKQAEITRLTEEVGRLTKRQQGEEKKLKNGSKELQYRLNQMETEKENLKKDLEQLSMDKERLQSERTNAMSESHQHKLESQKKSRELNLKEETIKGLRADLQEKKTANERAAERERMKADEVKDLRVKQIELEAELKTKEGEIEDFRRKFRNLEKEITDLNSKFDTEEAARAEELKKLENEDKNRNETMAQLQASKRSVEAELENTKVLLQEKAQLIKIKEDETNKFRMKLRTLERQCDGMEELQQNLHKAQKDRKMQDEINDDLKSKLISALRRAKPLGEDLTGAQRPQEFPAIVDDVIKAMQEIMSRGGEIEKKLTDLEAKNLALPTSEAIVAMEEIVLLKHQHGRLESDYDKVLKAKTELESKLYSIEKQALEDKAKGDGQLTAKDATIQELKRTTESLTKNKDTAEESLNKFKEISTKLEKEIEELEKKNKQAEKEKEDIKQSCHSENESVRKSLEDAQKMLKTAQNETKEQASLTEKKLQDQWTAHRAEIDKLQQTISELTENDRLRGKDAETKNTEKEEILHREVAKLRGGLEASKALEAHLQSQVKDLQRAKKLLEDEPERQVGIVNNNISKKVQSENRVLGYITNEKRPSQTAPVNPLGKSAEQKSHKSPAKKASLHRQDPLSLSKCDGPVEADAGEKQDQGSLSEDDSEASGSLYGEIQDVVSSSSSASKGDQHLSLGEPDRVTTNILCSQRPRLNSQGPQENPAVQNLLSKAMARNRANGTGIPPLYQNNPKSSSVGINSTSHPGQLQLISVEGEHSQVRDSYEGSNRAQVSGPVVRANTRNAVSRLQTPKPTYSGRDFAPLSGNSGSCPPSSNSFAEMRVPDGMQSTLDELRKSIAEVNQKVSDMEYRSSREATKRKTSESPELDEEGQVSKRQRHRKNVSPEVRQAPIDSREKKSEAKSRKPASRRNVKVKAVNEEVTQEEPSLPKKDKLPGSLTLDDKCWIVDRIANHESTKPCVYLRNSSKEECNLTLRQVLLLGTKNTCKKNSKQLRAFYERNKWPVPDDLAFSKMQMITARSFEVSFKYRNDKANRVIPVPILLEWGYRAAQMLGSEYVKEFEKKDTLEKKRNKALLRLSSET